KELIAFDSNKIAIHIQAKVGKYYLIYGIYYKNQKKTIEKLMLAKNFESETEWRELTLNPRYVQPYPFAIFYIFVNTFYGSSSNVSIIEMEPNTLIIQTLDNYHKTPIVFLAKLKPNSILWADSIEVDSLDILNSELYVTPPYPVPTNEYVKFRVYFNPAYDYEQMNFYFTDVMGRIVAEENAFDIIPLTNHSIEVKCSLNNLSQGAYFIIVKLQNTMKEIPVILIK
ncbi:MAG: hypothetical protein ACK42Z_09960, partial [Candidatus Kapaibacteriota bacterium]